ncbi:MAG: A/G-specific adenine glycosylase [Elusimicrobia bacterium RIFCSPLOWO2_12_FULL_59_9]|nr:MAG: A/G-specific adenine glycosylase [Elusimicrobia bacterium RIFCSPLOWO2_12_FULL_59_9]
MIKRLGGKDNVKKYKLPEAARGRLLRWFDGNKRDLPWRKTSDAYKIWVSEIMLQQTQVSTVIPFYRRFVEEFPTCAALAAASGDRVLQFWSGLGYYSRARSLHRAAREIMRNHAGRFPSLFGAALGLPGVGRYTAGAVLSIAYGKPFPVLDANVMRVFARLFALRRNLKDAAVQKELWAAAEDLISVERPGDWNQALMELGALVCVPENPRCRNCPVRGACRARRRGLENALPDTGKKPAGVPVVLSCLLAGQGGKLLLEKRPKDARFLPGHWGLPEISPLKAPVQEPVLTVRHCITRHNIRLGVYRSAVPKPFPSNYRWVARENLDRYLVSSLWKKVLAGYSSSLKSSRSPAE